MNEKVMVDDKKLVKYLLKKIPDQHPFRLSRLLFLIDTECIRKNGKPCSTFKYVITPYGFYIDGFPPFLMSIEGVEKVEIKDKEGNPVKGFFRLTGDVDIKLPQDIKGVVDTIIENSGNLPDDELNRVVMELPEYREKLPQENKKGTKSEK